MKRLMIIIGLLLVVTLLVLTSCAKAVTEEEGAVAGGVFSVSSSAPESDMSRAEEPSPVAIAPEELGTGEQWATERMIVRTGNISLVVEDVPIAIDQITKIAEDFDGYVVSSTRWGEEERLAGSVAIRVPAEHFDVIVRALRELAVAVTSESTSSKDVTEEYVDLSAKLGNLEATEEQLLRLMEKAETVDDILAVQRELSKTRGDIEQTKGRMQYLERTSATSLIEVSLEQSKLYAKLYANKTSVKEGEKVQFYSQIAGGFPPYSYEWDFGDGSTSTNEALTHAYKSAGSYTVSLTVTDDRDNTDTETRSEYITVLPGWSAGSIVSGAWNGLVTFGHVLGDIFIWIGIFSPVWIVGGGIVCGIIYWRRRRKKAK